MCLSTPYVRQKVLHLPTSVLAFLVKSFCWKIHEKPVAEREEEDITGHDQSVTGLFLYFAVVLFFVYF